MGHKVPILLATKIPKSSCTYRRQKFNSFLKKMVCRHLSKVRTQHTKHQLGLLLCLAIWRYEAKSFHVFLKKMVCWWLSEVRTQHMKHQLELCYLCPYEDTTPTAIQTLEYILLFRCSWCLHAFPSASGSTRERN